MESVGSSVAGSTTRKKEKANNEVVEDIISNKLPEALISHILSFLPTKDAARTSVLSKRWIHRWTTITKLDLNDLFYSRNWRRRKGKKQCFVNFVNRALFLTTGSSLESFSLVIGDMYDVSLLNSWISTILNRGVKNFSICSEFELPLSSLTSHSLFNSVYLEELVLFTCYCAIKVYPVKVNLGCLKLLRLCGIAFTIDSSVSRRLRFPVLKKFEARNCTWLCAKGVTVEAPLLESVFIAQDLESVSHEPRSCAITFSALHLKDFIYSGYGISQPITLSKPSSAHNASADISLVQCLNQPAMIPETGSCAFLLLKQFSQAKRIRFDGSDVLTQAQVASLPIFSMLSHLELWLVTGEVLLGLLQRSPVLKTLLVQ